MASRVGAKGPERSWAAISIVEVGEEGEEAHGSVEVQDVDAVGSELLETRLERRKHIAGLVVLGFARVDNLGGEGQAAVLPAGIAGPGLLGAADVHAGRVDLIVSARLKDVEGLFELVELRDTGACFLIGSKGHETEDDAVPGGLGDEGRHGCGGGDADANGTDEG